MQCTRYLYPRILNMGYSYLAFCNPSLLILQFNKRVELCRGSQFFSSLSNSTLSISSIFDSYLQVANIGSVEIPDLTSLPEIHGEPVFHGYRKGGCRSGGGEAPENVMKNNDFYRAQILFINNLIPPFFQFRNP
jgi:hypothetical protein